MSKLKLGPQESEENGECNDLCMVQGGGHRSKSVVTLISKLVSGFQEQSGFNP